MEKFIITEEMIQNAEDYIPLAEKSAYAMLCAPLCTKELEFDGGVNSENAIPLPTIKGEEPGVKALAVMRFFLSHYLKIELPDDFTDKEYDKYAGSHIFNQVERFKGTPLKDKVFDILADFKEFKKILDAHIANEILRNNEPIERLQCFLTVNTSPETIKNAFAEMNETLGEIEKAKKDIGEKQKSAEEQSGKLKKAAEILDGLKGEMNS